MKTALLATLVLTMAATAVSAKGLTTRITLRDATIQTSIDITDPSVLKAFNVWAGPGTFANDVEGMKGFIIDWPAGIARDRPRGLGRYEVMFYVRYLDRSTENSCMSSCMSMNLHQDEDLCIYRVDRTTTMAGTSGRFFMATISRVIGSTRLTLGTMPSIVYSHSPSHRAIDAHVARREECCLRRTV
jgi:hypothetical protein